MSDTFSKVEVITSVARRRRFSIELKLAVVAETIQPGMSISYVARRHGLSPSLIILVFCWRRLMSDGARKPCAPTMRWWRLPRSAASQNECASLSGCWAARRLKARSSRRARSRAGKKTDAAVALAGAESACGQDRRLRYFGGLTGRP